MLDKSRSVKIRNLRKIIASLVELVDSDPPLPFTEFTFSDEALYSKEKLKKRISEIPLTLELQTRTDLALLYFRLVL